MPSGVLERGLLLKLRFALDHYVNLRPSKVYPSVGSPLANPGEVDFVVVREGTEGPYVGNGGALRVGRLLIGDFVHHAAACPRRRGLPQVEGLRQEETRLPLPPAVVARVGRHQLLAGPNDVHPHRRARSGNIRIGVGRRIRGSDDL